MASPGENGDGPRPARPYCPGLWFGAGLRFPGWLIVVIGLSPAWANDADEDAQSRELQAKLEQAAELNVTAPWPESQIILDEIEPLLDQATPDQYATYHLLRIRNLALDGDISTALDLTEELLEQDIPRHQRLNALMRGANLAMVVRRFEQGFDYLNRSLELEREVDHPGRPTDVHSLAADMLRSVGKVDEAIKHGQQAVEVAVQRGDARAECVARMRLSAAYRASDDVETAIRHYRRAMDTCQQANDPVYTAIVEFGLGDALRKLGRTEEAIVLLESALDRHLENDYALGVAETRLALGTLQSELGRFDQAEELLSSATDYLARTERWDDLARAHGELGEIAAGRGDHERAVDHLQAQMVARERFLDMDRARHLAYLEVEFDTQITEQELALLREQARVRELEEQSRAHQRRLRHAGYLATGFLVVVLALLLAHATRERRRYRSLSHLDGLTGLNNHTRFFEVADPAFRSARENDTPFTLILADIDLFKRVNDTHGHLTGDVVLRRVAARLRDVFSAKGIIGRVGGEEFAIALPGHRMADVDEPLQRLRRKLRTTRADDEHIPISMSFGVAQTNGESTLTELRKRADDALYQAKKSGRDRVIYVDAPA